MTDRLSDRPGTVGGRAGSLPRAVDCAARQDPSARAAVEHSRRSDGILEAIGPLEGRTGSSRRSTTARAGCGSASGNASSSLPGRREAGADVRSSGSPGRRPARRHGCWRSASATARTSVPARILERLRRRHRPDAARSLPRPIPRDGRPAGLGRGRAASVRRTRPSTPATRSAGSTTTATTPRPSRDAAGDTRRRPGGRRRRDPGPASRGIGHLIGLPAIDGCWLRLLGLDRGFVDMVLDYDVDLRRRGAVTPGPRRRRFSIWSRLGYCLVDPASIHRLSNESTATPRSIP